MAKLLCLATIICVMCFGGMSVVHSEAHSLNGTYDNVMVKVNSEVATVNNAVTAIKSAPCYLNAAGADVNAANSGATPTASTCQTP
jgi:hypothetical protein